MSYPKSICVDIDDTISFTLNRDWENAKPNIPLIEKLNKLYDEGLKQPICEECGQDENWRGKHISMILDHINGVHDDNRLENLRIVCPNCNAALPTHCGRNSKRNKREKILKSIEEKFHNKKLQSINSRVKERPDFNLLQKDVTELGYSATGRKYGVSDNAVRKWVKFYEKYDVH